MMLFGVVLGIRIGQFLSAEPVREEAKNTEQLKNALQRSEANAGLLAEELSEVRLQQGVAVGATEELQASLSSQQHEITALREEIARYREILAPGSVPVGVQISEFRIVQTVAVDLFSYEVRLSQDGAANPRVRGTLSLSVEADAAGAMVQLPIEKLDSSGEQPIKVGFQHFQHIKGGFRLPPGHLPLRVVVKLVPIGGAKPVVRSFPWIVESL